MKHHKCECHKHEPSIEAALAQHPAPSPGFTVALVVAMILLGLILVPWAIEAIFVQ